MKDCRSRDTVFLFFARFCTSKAASSDVFSFFKLSVSLLPWLEGALFGVALFLMSGCFSVSNPGESWRWQLCMPAVLLGLALFALDEAVFGCHFTRNEDELYVNGLRVFV